jgi:GDP-L-fucose synthase
MRKEDRIYIAGHRGMVGSAIVRRLTAEGYTNLITREQAELDLRDQAAVAAFFKAERPLYVFLAAGKQGGISGPLPPTYERGVYLIRGTGIYQ